MAQDIEHVVDSSGEKTGFVVITDDARRESKILWDGEPSFDNSAYLDAVRGCFGPEAASGLAGSFLGRAACRTLQEYVAPKEVLKEAQVK